MEISEIGIIGSGLMGTGIAQVVLQAGFKVVLKDVDRVFLNKSFQEIKDRIKKLEEKGSIDNGSADRMLENIRLTSENDNLGSVDFIIEAATEDLKIKQNIFLELDKICRPEVIFVTNTSCMTVTEIADSNPRAGKIAGMHFFYPAPVMRLIEITPGSKTNKETISAVREFAKKIDKTPVMSKDSPGFIVNRLLVPFINEAIKLVEEGVSPGDVDTALKLGANHKIGPLELADLISLDGLLKSISSLYQGTGDEKYRPSALLENMVKSGFLGRKTNKGFYEYD